jgi:hypothetical protein
VWWSCLLLWFYSFICPCTCKIFISKSTHQNFRGAASFSPWSILFVLVPLQLFVFFICCNLQYLLGVLGFSHMLLNWYCFFDLLYHFLHRWYCLIGKRVGITRRDQSEVESDRGTRGRTYYDLKGNDFGSILDNFICDLPISLLCFMVSDTFFPVELIWQPQNPCWLR